MATTATATVSNSISPGSVVSSRRKLHLVLMAALMVGHTFLHYAVLLPGIGKTFENLPFFNLHVVHEAEYLAVIAYASLVFRLRGGIIALAATLVASTPFVISPYFSTPEYSAYLGVEDYGYAEFGPSGPGNQIIDLAVVLAIGVWLVFVNEMWGRERDKKMLAHQVLEQTNQKLEFAVLELQSTNQQLYTSNRQLNGLNQTVQARLNKLYGSMADQCDKERVVLKYEPDSPLRRRFEDFVKQVQDSINGN